MKFLHKALKSAPLGLALMAAALLPLAPTSASAQDNYPNRTITVVVGFQPGGGTDAAARVLSAELSKQFGVPVVVENRPGANATIGTQFVVDAKPDGYTLLVGTTGSMIISPSLGDTRYDPKTDLEGVSLLTRIGSILAVATNSRFASLEDMLKDAKEKPGTVTYATSGVGSPQHLAGLMLDKMAGTTMIAVPYQGTGPGLAAVLGGHVDSILTQPQAVMGNVQAGTMRVFGISNPSRLSSYPDIPTIAEQGLDGYAATNWYSLFAPKGTPEAIINKLHEGVKASMQTEAMLNFLKETGSDPIGSTPAELEQIVADELASYTEILKGMKFE